jgi:hypothetical protein
MDEPEVVEAKDESPKVIKNLNAWIGGLTGVVLALTGLVAAFQGLVGPRPADPKPDAMATAPQAAGAADPTADPTAADQGSADEEDGARDGEPWLYKNADTSIEWNGSMWVQKNGDEVVHRFEDRGSADGYITALDHGRNMWIRWPVAGGDFEESEDQESWNPAFTAYPPGVDGQES